MSLFPPVRGGALACVLLLSACGSQISHGRVVAAAGLQGTSESSGGTASATGSTGTALDPGASTGVSTGGATGSTGSGSLATSTGGSTGSSPTTGATGSTGSTASTGGSTTGSTSTTGSSGGTTTGTAATSGCGKGTGTLKLGNIGPYSATSAGSTASPARDILKVWQAEVNAKGGICGRKVEVLSRDDKGNSSQAAADMKDLVENQHVVAFVGNITALTGAAQRQYLESKKVPALGGSDQTANWFTSAVFFPQGASAPEINYAHLKLVQGRPNGTKIAFLYCAEFAACSDGYNAFVNNKIPEKAGSTIVYAKKVSLTAISFASECQEAKKAGAGALYAGGDATFVNRVANSCGQQGITFDYLVNGSSVGANQESNQYLNNHEFVATTGQSWPSTNTPGAKLYSESIARYAPNVPKTGNSMDTWIAALMAEHILQLVGDKDVTPASVIAAAYKVKNYDNLGLSGPISYAPGAQHSNQCVGAAQLVNGAFVAVAGGKLSCRTGPPLGGAQ